MPACKPMHHVQGSSDLTERIRAEIGKLVTPETLPDMTKRLLRRKVEDALCLQPAGVTDWTMHYTVRASLGFCKNASIS